MRVPQQDAYTLTPPFTCALKRQSGRGTRLAFVEIQSRGSKTAMILLALMLLSSRSTCKLDATCTCRSASWVVSRLQPICLPQTFICWGSKYEWQPLLEVNVTWTIRRHLAGRDLVGHNGGQNKTTDWITALELNFKNKKKLMQAYASTFSSDILWSLKKCVRVKGLCRSLKCIFLLLLLCGYLLHIFKIHEACWKACFTQNTQNLYHNNYSFSSIISKNICLLFFFKKANKPTYCVIPNHFIMLMT